MNQGENMTGKRISSWALLTVLSLLVIVVLSYAAQFSIVLCMAFGGYSHVNVMAVIILIIVAAWAIGFFITISSRWIISASNKVSKSEKGTRFLVLGIVIISCFGVEIANQLILGTENMYVLVIPELLYIAYGIFLIYNGAIKGSRDIPKPQEGLKDTALPEETEKTSGENDVKKSRNTVGGIPIALVVINVALLVIIFLGGIYYKFNDEESWIEKADKSVVTIYAFLNEDNYWQGSGFVYLNNQTVVTNYHVIDECTYILVVTSDGIEYEVDYIIQSSVEDDLAILHVDEPMPLEPLRLGDSGNLRKGEKVYAIGSPEGWQNTVSEGVVSGFDNDFIQISAPISHGSSGGALFNKNGLVIGITSNTWEDGQNINFAIPVEKLRKLAIDAEPVEADYNPEQGGNGIEVKEATDNTISFVTEDLENERYNIYMPKLKIINVSFPNTMGIVTPDCIVNRNIWRKYKYDPDDIQENTCVGDVYVKAIYPGTNTRYTLLCSEEAKCGDFVGKNYREYVAIVSKYCNNILGKFDDSITYTKTMFNRKDYLEILAQGNDIPNFPQSKYVKTYVTHKNGYEYTLIVERDDSATIIGDKNNTEGILKSLDLTIR